LVFAWASKYKGVEGIEIHMNPDGTLVVGGEAIPVPRQQEID
jgi:hypothetical protein